MYFFVMLDNIKTIFTTFMDINMTIVIMAFIGAFFTFLDPCSSVSDWGGRS